jgi:hypothetical protein
MPRSVPLERDLVPLESTAESRTDAYSRPVTRKIVTSIMTFGIWCRPGLRANLSSLGPASRQGARSWR